MVNYSSQEVLKYLTNKTNLHTFSEVSSGYNIFIPETSGVYAWHFNNLSTGLLSIVYIGETNNLRERIKTHCTSYANSPMRQGLRTMLHGTSSYPEPMRISLENHWMSDNAFICWIELENRKEVEEYLIKEIKPLFNIEHNPQNRG